MSKAPNVLSRLGNAASAACELEDTETELLLEGISIACRVQGFLDVGQAL